MIAFSGPDASGKSSAVSRVKVDLLERGWSPTRVYLYGCFLCRRWPDRGLLPVPGTSRNGLRQVPLLVTLHALVDLVECAVRLHWARRRGWAGARSGHLPMVVADRSPLDGLVKHDPGSGSLLERGYLGLARQFHTIFLLTASTAELMARDPTHSPAELAVVVERFDRWSAIMGNVTRVDTSVLSLEGVTSVALEVADRSTGK